MPASSAQTGYGVRFGKKAAGTTVDFFAEVTTVSGIGFARDPLEATTLESPDGYKEFIAGLAGAKPITVNVNFVPSVTAPIVAAFSAGEGEFRVLFPQGTVALDFAGIVTDFSLGDLDPNGKMTGSIIIQPSGKPSFVAVTG